MKFREKAAVVFEGFAVAILEDIVMRFSVMFQEMIDAVTEGFVAESLEEIVMSSVPPKLLWELLGAWQIPSSSWEAASRGSW